MTQTRREARTAATDGTLPRNESQPDAIEEDEGNDTPQQQETRAPDSAQLDAGGKDEFIGKLQDTLKDAIAEMGTKLGEVVASLAERERTRTDAKLDEIQARITEFAQREAGRAKTTSAKLDSLLSTGPRVQQPSLSKQASGQREAPTSQQAPPSPRREVRDEAPGMFSHISNGSDGLPLVDNKAVLKPKLPAPFDGDTAKTDVFKWAAQMDLYVRAFHNVTTEQIFNAVLSNLTGSAADWAWNKVRNLRESGHKEAMPWVDIGTFYTDLANIFHRADNLTEAHTKFLNLSLLGFKDATTLRNTLIKARLEARVAYHTFALHILAAVRRDWGTTTATALSALSATRQFTQLVYEEQGGATIEPIVWEDTFTTFLTGVLDTGMSEGHIGSAAALALASRGHGTVPRHTTTAPVAALTPPLPKAAGPLKPVFAFFRKYRDLHGEQKFRQLMADNACLNCGSTEHRVKQCPHPSIVGALLAEPELRAACRDADIPMQPEVLVAVMHLVDQESNRPPPATPQPDWAAMDHAAVVAHIAARVHAEDSA